MPQHGGMVGGHFDRHLQQGQGQGLALRVGPQRPTGAAGEHIVQDEVESEQVRRLVPDNARGPERAEVVLYDLAVKFSRNQAYPAGV